MKIRVTLVPDPVLRFGIIAIKGGEVCEEKDGESEIRCNFDDFAYEVGTGVWTRLTNRNWRQYEIRDREGKTFMRGPRFLGCCSLDDEPWKGEVEEPVDDVFVYVMPEALFPSRFKYETIWSEEFSLDERILVEGIPVFIKMGTSIQIIVEGPMDAATANALVEDIRGNIEAETGRACDLKSYS